jgi:hypothetical protein
MIVGHRPDCALCEEIKAAAGAVPDPSSHDPGPIYDAKEQDLLLEVFKSMLGSVTKDGGNKRARGEKPPWWRDGAHESAIYSHLSKWKHGELADADSGAHPLVHLAWRSLAIAYQETYGKRDPEGWWSS